MKFFARVLLRADDKPNPLQRARMERAAPLHLNPAGQLNLLTEENTTRTVLHLFGTWEPIAA